MSGWIKLHRKIFENGFYFSEPFTRSQAWIDMLLLANYNDGFFYKRGIRVNVLKGQIGWDIETLAKRWRWSRGKVERLLIALEKEHQIVRQKTNVTTIISIVNYEFYQIDDKPNGKANSKTNGQQIVKQTDTNNNNKERKEDIDISKKFFSDIEKVQLDEETMIKFKQFSNDIILKCSRIWEMPKPLTSFEFYQLIKNYGRDSVFEKLISLSNRTDLKKRHSAYLTVLNWCEKEKRGK